MAFCDWLERVLVHGESVQTESPEEGSIAEVLPLVEVAYRRHAADVAGTPLPMEVPVALDAAKVLAKACWAQSSGADFSPSELWRTEPTSPEAHLSADLFFRFLPGVLNRAKARHADGPLSRSLDALLRRWPLSGVLADLDGAPVRIDFGGHAGLELLYAERLLARPRSGWVPRSGPVYEWVERVFQAAGRPIPKAISQEAGA